MVRTLRKSLVSPELHRLLHFSWAGLIVIFIIYYFWRNWATFNTYDWQFNPWYMLVAFVAAMVRRLLGGIRWVMIALYRQEASTWNDIIDHLRVYFLSNLANYIPGSLWYMLSRIRLSSSKGLSPFRTSMGLIYEMGLLVWSGCVIGVYATVVISPYKQLNFAGLIPVLIIFSLLTIHPKIVNPALNWLLRVMKRPPMIITASFNWGLKLWVVSVGVWIAGGISQFYLLKAFYPDLSFTTLGYITSAAALAWTIGFLTPWAPSGLGVRDGLLVWLLELYVPAPVAVIAAVFSRLITLAEDLSWALIAFLLQRR